MKRGYYQVEQPPLKIKPSGDSCLFVEESGGFVIRGFVFLMVKQSSGKIINIPCGVLIVPAVIFEGKSYNYA